MKTKLTFFCTHCQYGEFEKVIFETVLDGEPFDSIYDAREWVDSNISELCDEFDFHLVFEWVIMEYEKTEEDISPVKIKDTFVGTLIFKEKKVKKAKVKKAIEITPEPRKQYNSMWIDPFGEPYIMSGTAQHNEFASEWLKEHDIEAYKKSYHGTYPYEVLQSKGWARILGWTRIPTFVLPDRIGPKLKTAIKDYCLSYGLDFPERLKS